MDPKAWAEIHSLARWATRGWHREFWEFQRKESRDKAEFVYIGYPRSYVVVQLALRTLLPAHFCRAVHTDVVKLHASSLCVLVVVLVSLLRVETGKECSAGTQTFLLNVLYT